MSEISPTYERRGNVTCVVLGRDFENLDEQSVDEIREDLLEKAYAADPPRVLVDLTNVKFFGSSFIEILFQIWTKINGFEEGKFGISGLTKYCTEVLEVTQLDKLWTLYPTVDEAVESMNS
jgi:anti-anti-sigma factor